MSIVKIEDHIPSRQTCKNLNRLGWVFPTIFKYGKQPEGYILDFDIHGFELEDLYEGDLFAPLFSEIVKHLPSGVDYQINDRYSGMKDYKEQGVNFLVTSPNLAETAAQVWCYLKENDLLPTQPDDHE